MGETCSGLVLEVFLQGCGAWNGVGRCGETCWKKMGLGRPNLLNCFKDVSREGKVNCLASRPVLGAKPPLFLVGMTGLGRPGWLETRELR
jgi:hypothetical protein